MLAGLGGSLYTATNRSNADFILQWEGASISNSVLRRMTSRPEENEEQLRQILARTKDEFIAEKVEQALAKLGKEGEESSKE